MAGAGADASATVKVSGDTAIPAGGLLNLADDSGVSIEAKRVVPGNFVEPHVLLRPGRGDHPRVPVVASANPDYADVKVPSGS